MSTQEIDKRLDLVSKTGCDPAHFSAVKPQPGLDHHLGQVIGSGPGQPQGTCHQLDQGHLHQAAL